LFDSNRHIATNLPVAGEVVQQTLDAGLKGIPLDAAIRLSDLRARQKGFNAGNLLTEVYKKAL
jgi:hypothetical protein